jgi:lipoprotein-anchoring transpeptidase ErfK/SrfK
MRSVTWIAAFFMLLLSGFSSAKADIVARISIASQEMTVLVDGEVAAVWPVSTGRKGYVTPRGVFRPQALRRMHYSRKYDNAPMPFSVFFRGGYAIHATHEVKRLGRPASHGCVRLARQNAATLFRWIREHGPSRTRIIIS